MHPSKTATYGTSTGTLRGHLALNSSPLKPSINKLSSQYIIQDHMTSHYYNLATIKSAIDNKPPKSTTLSIKKRDQTRRDILLKQMRNGTSIRPRSTTLKAKKRLSSSYDGIENRVTSRPLTATSSWSPSHYEPYAQSTTARPKTASSFTSRKSFGTEKLSPRSAGNATRKDVLNLTYGGDYLDRHQNRFCNSEGKPFMPRTKKRSGKSFLSQSKHYAPPVHSRRKKEFPPKDASTPRSKTSHKHITEEDVRRIDETDRTTEHKRWIEEQSEFVQKLTLIEQEEQERARKRNRSRPSSTSSFARKQIDAEEEELKYLEFVKEVTNDILTTGVYSDSVLHKLMERHVERRRHDLNVKKMWAMLERLKDDLGMSNKQKSLLDSDHPSKLSPYSGYSEHDETYVSPRRETYTKELPERSAPETFASDRRRYEDASSTFATVSSEGFVKAEGSENDLVREDPRKKSVDKDVEEFSSRSFETKLETDFEIPAKPSISSKSIHDERNIRSASQETLGSTFSKSKSKPASLSSTDFMQTQHKDSVEVKSQSTTSAASKLSERNLRRQHSGSSCSESVKSYSATKVTSTPIVDEKSEDTQSRFIRSEANLEEDLLVASIQKSSPTASEDSIFGKEKQKSTSLTSLKSSSSKAKEKPSEERFEEQSHQMEGSGLQSQSASSLGSRTSAGSMLRARKLTKDERKSDVVDRFSSKSTDEDDRKIDVDRFSSKSSYKDDRKSDFFDRFSSKSSCKDDRKSDVADRFSTKSANEDDTKSDVVDRFFTKSTDADDTKADAIKTSPFSPSSSTRDQVEKEIASKQSSPRHSLHSSSSSVKSSSSRRKVNVDSPAGKSFSEEQPLEETHRTRSFSSSNRASGSYVRSLANGKQPGSSDSLRKLALENEAKSSDDFFRDEIRSRTSSNHSVQNGSVGGSSDSHRNIALENVTKSVDADETHSSGGSRTPSVSSLLDGKQRGSSDSLRKMALENESRLVDEASPDTLHSTHSSRKSSVHSLPKEASRRSSQASSLITLDSGLKSPDEVHSDHVLSDSAQPASKLSHETDVSVESKSTVTAKPRSSVLGLQRGLPTSETDSIIPVPRKRSGNLTSSSFSFEKASVEKFFDAETRSDDHKDSDHVLSTTSENRVKQENVRKNVNDETFLTETLDERVKDDGSSSSKSPSAQKSLMDEIREAALRSSDPAAPPPPDTEDESDYESVAALSMVIKPQGKMKPFEFASDSGSEVMQSTVKSPDQMATTSAKDTLKPEALDGTLKSDIAYSDDFENDSDAF